MHNIGGFSSGNTREISLQRTLAEQQVAEYSQQQELCLHCSKKLLQKDKRTII